MDFLSHAVAGAAVGYAFGNPALGAAVALIPDVPIWGKRREAPNAMYDVTHTMIFTLLVGAVVFKYMGTPLVGLALLSHLVLDLPTHGRQWGAMSLFPLTTRRFHWIEHDWELFDINWWVGTLVTIIWSTAWLTL